MKSVVAALLAFAGTAAIGGETCERVAVEHGGSVLYYGFRNVPSGGCASAHSRKDRSERREAGTGLVLEKIQLVAEGQDGPEDQDDSDEDSGHDDGEETDDDGHDDDGEDGHDDEDDGDDGNEDDGDDEDDDTPTPPATEFIIGPTVVTDTTQNPSPSRLTYGNLRGVRNRAYVRH